MHAFKVIFSILGRILISAVFLMGNVNNILYWDDSMQALQSVLENWKVFEGPNALFGIVTLIQNNQFLVLAFATGCELLGAMLVLVGLIPRVGAILLLLFLIPTTILLYPFWYVTQPERDMQLIMFMQNLSTMGGIFVVLGFGSGFRSKSKF